METSKVVYFGELRCELTHNKSNQKLNTDAPTDNNGKGEAFSPTDLLATSLAACMFTIMGIYANNHKIMIDGSDASVKKIMSKEPPRRVVGIEVHFKIKLQNPNTKTQQALINCAKTCPVALSLSPEIEQKIIFEFI